MDPTGRASHILETLAKEQGEHLNGDSGADQKSAGNSAD